MNFYFKAILFLLCMTAMNISVHADALTDLNHRLKKLDHFSAHLSQLIMPAEGKKPYRVSGLLQVQKPNQLYWETFAPMPQVIVADGKQLWIYDKDLDQVTVKPMSHEFEATPALLFSGRAEQIAAAYRVKIWATGQANTTGFELTPKSKKSTFKKLILIFNQRSLQAMDLQDPLGQATHIEFSQVQMNTKIDQQKFHFVPPKGVDVVKDFNAP